MIYLDWAATAIPREDIIRESLDESFKYYGNPSAQHNSGLEAKDQIENCRNKCADLLGTAPEKLFFTSGATESNNIALLSFLKKHSTGEIITSSIEHPSILEPVKILNKFGWKVKQVSPDDSGTIKLKKLTKSITEETKIVSLIYVHNETGVIQPLEEIIKIIRAKELEYSKKIHIHIDGVQAIGKIFINLESLGADSFSLSGHKFGAPKGVGLLYFNNPKEPLYRGGGQEKGIRPGTENLFGISAITKCLERSISELPSSQDTLTTIMSCLISGIRDLGISTIPKNRDNNNFVPNILSFTVPPIPGEVMARVLNQKGFMVSTGSACSSNKKSNTKGILSMGISTDEGFSSLRVSIGRTTTKDDIDYFLKALKESVKELAP